MDTHFRTYEWVPGKLSDCDPNFPTDLSCWEREGASFGATGTHFGFVFEGTTAISCEAGNFQLKTGMYFCVDGAVEIMGGRGIVITRLGENGLFQIGGPVENRGRLKYIDGCTDTLLIPPVRMGDACLNLLFFPPGIDQTSHTHPSDRIGVVYSGAGECETPNGVTALLPGVIFRIPAEGQHKFRTHDSNMRIIAYHPDSDFGPTDEDHPMLNRTMVDGVSAAQLNEIRTA